MGLLTIIGILGARSCFCEYIETIFISLHPEILSEKPVNSFIDQIAKEDRDFVPGLL